MESKANWPFILALDFQSSDYICRTNLFHLPAPHILDDANTSLQHSIFKISAPPLSTTLTFPLLDMTCWRLCWQKWFSVVSYYDKQIDWQLHNFAIESYRDVCNKRFCKINSPLDITVLTLSFFQISSFQPRKKGSKSSYLWSLCIQTSRTPWSRACQALTWYVVIGLENSISLVRGQFTVNLRTVSCHRGTHVLGLHLLGRVKEWSCERLQHCGAGAERCHLWLLNSLDIRNMVLLSSINNFCWLLSAIIKTIPI